MSTRNNKSQNQASKSINLKAIPKRDATAYISTSTFIVVIAVLAVIGSAIYFYKEYKSMKTKTQEKLLKDIEPNSCPDYWEVVDKTMDDTGKVTGIKCRNIMRLGKVALNPGEDVFTFDDEIFINPNTKNIARCQWARQNGVAWSGYEKAC